MDTLVKKSTALLFLNSVVSGSEESIEFIASFDDTLQIFRTVKLTRSEWMDLGTPNCITVTIKPGDTLNKGH